MGRLKTMAGFMAMVAALALIAGPAAAQQDANKAKIEAAAGRIYRGLAKGDLGEVGRQTILKYTRKLTPDKIKLSPTGPKLSMSFNDEVAILRADGQSAVVEAEFFKPDSAKETPAGEVSKLRIYLVQNNGDWFADAPNKKQAGNDANNGGFYQSGSFTFCPNSGFVFLPNHFSTEVKPSATAVCR